MKQVIVREEEKPWELQLFAVDILVEALGDFLNYLIAVDEVLKGFMLISTIQNKWLLRGLLHYHFPFLVNRAKQHSHFRQLSLNVWRVKNRPEVHPASLSLAPLFENFLDFDKILFPIEDVLQEKLSVGRTCNQHCFLNVLIK